MSSPLSKRVIDSLLPIARPMLRRRNSRELKRFSALGEEAAHLVAIHHVGCEWAAIDERPEVAEIEEHRDRMNKDDSPLVTGELGESAPWDRDQRVCDAAIASRIPYHARYLAGLVCARRPAKALELGTNIGVSGAYIATALKASGSGLLVTMDASPYRQRIAKDLFDRIGLENTTFLLGHFDQTFDNAVSDHGPFDFAFIDGNHQRDPTLHYARSITDNANGPVVIVFDDIRWSKGMIEAWDELRKDHRMVAALDLYRISLCIMDANNKRPPCVSKPLYSAFN